MHDPMNLLSKEAKALLGTNHPMWTNGLFGDLSERKVTILNKMAADGFSPGWIQSIARFPTQMQEIICRLVIEKKLDCKAIEAGTGLKRPHIQATLSVARTLGLIDHVASDTMSEQRHIWRLRAEERRAARKEAKDNPQKFLTSVHVEKDGRQGVRHAQANALHKATQLLSGHSTAPAKPAVSKAPTPPVGPVIVETVIVEPDGVEADPSKRIVEVSLRMTVEELSDFVKTVNARKAEAAVTE
jgi:hypothetical protein